MRYVNIKQLDLDTQSLNLYCNDIEATIINRWGDKLSHDMVLPTISKTTALHAFYNFLLFPHPELHKLYFEIKNMFNVMREHTGEYYITMWLNIYRNGEFLDWHGHNKPQDNGYHGYFSVNSEPSTTTYKLPDNSIESVINSNNQLVISRSNGDIHKVSEWQQTNPRITLAFDILPYEIVNHTFMHHNRTNNWIPI